MGTCRCGGPPAAFLPVSAPTYRRRSRPLQCYRRRAYALRPSGSGAYCARAPNDGAGGAAARHYGSDLRNSAIKPTEKCFLVGVGLNHSPAQEANGKASIVVDVDASLEELGQLAETAGMRVVGCVTQRLDKPVTSTYIGSGKVREVRAGMLASGATTCVFDDELSPAQQRTLEKAFGGEEAGIKVLDRTALILDIFAQHAQTREGQLQVELALYQYRLPRLTRMWTHLERQSGAGGVGLRGPGETQLEVDRRIINEKVAMLHRQLESVRVHRSHQRKARKLKSIPLVGIVGYTNAGKSSLLNAVTTATVLAEDMLFATLDPTTRKATLPGLRVHPEVLITDTVGFIRKLPTQLVAAFRATLEEVAEADVLLHVLDYSHPIWEAQAETVRGVLAELHAADKPTIMVWNKIDLLSARRGDGHAGGDGDNDDAAITARINKIADRCEFPTVAVSAKTGQGMDGLVRKLEDVLASLLVYVEVVVPYDRGDVMHELYTQGSLEHEQYLAEGTYVAASVPARLANTLASFRVDVDDASIVTQDGVLTDVRDAPEDIAAAAEAEDELEMWKQLAKKRHTSGRGKAPT